MMSSWRSGHSAAQHPLPRLPAVADNGAMESPQPISRPPRRFQFSRLPSDFASFAAELIRAVDVGACGGAIGGSVLLGFGGAVIGASEGKSPIGAIIFLGGLGAISGAIVGGGAGPIGAALSLMLWAAKSPSTYFKSAALGLLESLRLGCCS